MIPRRDLGDGSGRTVLVDGSMVGGYQVSYLASGGMSLVYKGEKHGQTFVLKEVQATNSREVPSLISEKTLLERLRHPALITYHTFFTESGYYYLVVDYVPGEPLAKFLQDGADPIAIDDVVEWALQLCDVFIYLHQQVPPVIYRDLKSENILLCDGKIKLIDFGIARVHKGTRQSDTELMGSPVTASPEHYGGAETDARSDIYTLGATIYELLTGGRRLQVGAFAFAPVQQLRPEVPEALDKAVLKALEFKPADRHQTAAEFRDALLRAVGRPVDSSAPPAASRGGGKKMGFAALLLVGLLSLAAVAVSRLNGSTNVSHESSLAGNLFAAGSVEGQPIVFMGEDVGLFQVTAWEKEKPEERARTLAKRLNTFYHSPCPACNMTALEPADIKIGRHQKTGDVVVFYAHMHGFDVVHWGPELLATVDEAQAKAFQVAPRFLAAYWRDLLRDTVALSRGFPVSDSALGEGLSQAMLQAREELSGEQATVDNLRTILRKTTATQASALRTLFEQVPQRQPEPDRFDGVDGYEPLRI